jgi:ribonuclease HI
MWGRGVIKTPYHLVYRWIFNCGEGTNTRAKLLGVWETLTLATHLSIHELQVLGDSKVVIEWMNEKGRIQASANTFNKSVLHEKELIKHFQEISFAHIFREFNNEADFLSKQAIQEPEGRITFFKWVNGTKGPKRQYNLY